MDRIVSRVFAVGVLAARLAAAQDALTVGSPAPQLQIAHWMKGEEVTEFEPGKIYVLEFWATWCAPCVASMDHLSEIAEQYRDDNVRVIGVSDEPLQTTVAFLFKKVKDRDLIQNDRIRYSLATDPDHSTLNDYLKAAMINAIPSTFIIGRTGVIEWIGHPTEIDPVIKSIVDGSWDLAAEREKSLRAMQAQKDTRAASESLSAAIEAENWDDAIAAIDRLIVLQPDSYYSTTKFAILLSKAKRYEEAYRYAREVMKQSWDTDPLRLYQLAWTISGYDRYPVPDEHRDLKLATRLCTRAAELAPNDSEFLRMLAQIHAQQNAFAEAATVQRRAIAALEAARDQVGPAYLDEFESDLRALQDTLSHYERGHRP